MGVKKANNNESKNELKAQKIERPEQKEVKKFERTDSELKREQHVQASVKVLQKMKVAS